MEPHLFNGIQAGTVGLKVQYLYPLFLQDLPDSLYMVRAHIVHHNNVSGHKSRKQGFFKYWTKRSPVVPLWYGVNAFSHLGGWKKGLSLSAVYSTGHDPLPFGMKVSVHTGGSGSY